VKLEIASYNELVYTDRTRSRRDIGKFKKDNLCKSGRTGEAEEREHGFASSGTPTQLVKKVKS